jgi:molybdenum cofactor cytidylyltransferase
LEIAALLLCGGAARRFGADKLLAGREPLAARAARNLICAMGRALAVIPLGRTRLRAVLEAAGCDVLETDRTESGMGASLAAAVAATDRASGWIVGLGDMPCIRAETIGRVRQALEAGALIAAPWDGRERRGHPVGFASPLRAELLALDQDIGAREVIQRHARHVKLVATDDPGIFVDIDTPEQLQQWDEGEKR